MTRLVLSAILFLGLVGPAMSQPPVPERRQSVTLDTDFYGADLQPMFDTTREACRNACFADPDCKAYTYNTRSSACFPKSAVEETQPYDGAVSARLFPTDPRVLAQAPARAAELDFLTGQDIAQARTLALEIGARHPGGQWDVAVMQDAARARQAEGDHLNAMRWTGAIVARTDAPGQWVEYARLSMRVQTQDEAEARRNAARAMHAAANAYLRGLTAPVRINALMQMAEALERVGRGRDMVSALRLAESIRPRADVMAALEDAVPKYGFRITGHRADHESASPRICAEFSEPLVKAGLDYTPYVQLPDPGLAVSAEERQLCIDGVEHGERYRVTFREGLPAASDETLIKDVEIAVYVRDRSPEVAFPGRSYVLPRAAGTALPIETVNLDEVELILRRVSDRNLLRTIQEDFFARPLSYYAEREFTEDIAEEVWTGTGEVQNRLNRTMTTRLPLGDVLADEAPGIYTLTARVPGRRPYEDPGATQWFVLTDLGLTTLEGTDGLHVFVRGLSDAEAREGIELTLLSQSNRELATLTTDARGHARFAPGLTRGTGAAAPAMVLARQGEDDLAFLSLTDPAFDLSDRGVEGRAPAPPVDVFLATDRGAYRAGEAIHATALARDEVADAVTGLPLTAILKRPDGVEYSRHLSAKDAAGGHVFEMPVDETAPRGAWTLQIKADPEAEPLASETVLVEDFLPERIDFDLALPDAPIRPGDAPPVEIAARYLFGAPGAGLEAEGTVRLSPKRRLEQFPGYVFGRHDEQVSARTEYVEGGTTGEDGMLTLAANIPRAKVTDRPYEATVRISVREGSGRPVEREVTRMLAPAGPMIGIRPQFDGVVAEGAEAAFDVIGIGADLGPRPMRVKWTLNRIDTRYQWYREYGNWNWEPITTRERVATGEISLTGDPATVSAPVKWGHYELVVERVDGDYIAASSDFHAGWYAPADTATTPDTLELSLDKPGYRPGDTANLRIVPRYTGVALVTVMSNRVIDMKAVEVSKGENIIPLPVTEEWGAGAYVTAQVIRPMDVAAGQNPARSLGLSYAKLDPGDRQLEVAIDAPERAEPRGALDIAVDVDGLAEGETGYVTIAAVDAGILNLTGFDSPDPSEHYFGQRRLGVEIRDLYGRLIDGMQGAEGRVRSGGDAGRPSFESPPPQDELVAQFTGPVKVGPDGTARASFDMPDFNGTVRLMAVAWSPRAVGQADRDVLVRDPVVVTASLPRFLAPGDESRLLLEIVHAEGPAGRMGLDVTTSGGLGFSGAVPSGFDLGAREKAVFRLPIRADEVGDHAVRVALTTPDGRQLTKSLSLGVRANDPEIATTRRFSLGAGSTFTLGDEVFANLRRGTGSAILSAGPLARFDAPGLLSALDRFPYGCTEQVTSQAMPLLYFGQVASALGFGNASRIEERIGQAVAQVLSRQSSGGGFGLWRAGSGDFWLDAYVTDFLSRARAQGHDVPGRAFSMAMDNLRNRVNYAPDFDDGGEDVAYALMVLAREGAARMGNLRYYADVKAGNFGSPLALAQLGAALAHYGDQTRADRMFAMAMRRLTEQTGPEAQIWRADYGTRLRDRAGVLALAAEAGSDAIDMSGLAGALAGAGPDMSTQEQAWTLLAVRALVDDPALSGLEVNGEPVSGPLVRKVEAGMPARSVTNTADRPVDITLTTLGVPETPPEAGGYGYAIDRSYYDMDGEPVSLDAVETGTRLVAVLRVRPFEDGAARLIVDDPLPAGLEIDNPNLLRAGDIAALDWLDPADARHTEFRADRFVAAVDWRSDKAFRLAYIVRAVTPGSYHHPAASVEDMYRPRYRARSATGRMRVTR
ncbi:alpha-2-macroglobulin family protein [Roseovarius salis]|uniref:alpha-2-macroglobulin family protein n=1 Tax=Roseovarius salis TaxID=3376063 RepID=UPI0037C90A31